MASNAESGFFPLFDEIFHPNFNKFWKIPMNLRNRCAISRKFLWICTKSSEYKITNKITSKEKLLKNNLKPVTKVCQTITSQKTITCWRKKSLFYVSTFERNVSYEYLHSVESSRIFLSLRFYVKSILENMEVQKVPFLQF